MAQEKQVGAADGLAVGERGVPLALWNSQEGLDLQLIRLGGQRAPSRPNRRVVLSGQPSGWSTT